MLTLRTNGCIMRICLIQHIFCTWSVPAYLRLYFCFWLAGMPRINRPVILYWNVPQWSPWQFITAICGLIILLQEVALPLRITKFSLFTLVMLSCGCSWSPLFCRIKSVCFFSFWESSAWIGGGQEAIIPRIIYTLVALAGLWCVSLLFRSRDAQYQAWYK